MTLHHPEFTIDPSHKDTRRHRDSGSAYTVCFSPKETILLLDQENVVYTFTGVLNSQIIHSIIEMYNHISQN